MWSNRALAMSWHTYDANSNRVTKTEAGYTNSTTYDRTGVPRTLTVDGSSASYVVDQYGNLTTSVVATPLALDATAPSTPGGLTATAAGSGRINLAWSAASDNVAVTSYQIYRGGTLVMTVSGTATAWSDFSVSPSTAYTYTVTATDAAGNASAASSPALATTSAGGTTETTVSASADAYVKNTNPSTNYGTSTTLLVKNDPATTIYHDFLTFPVSGLTGTVLATRLDLTSETNSSDSSRHVCAYPVSDTSWTETGITWSNAPTIGGTALACVVGNQPVGSHSYDIGPIAGNGTYSYALTQDTPTLTTYGSRESIDPPALVVTTGTVDTTAPSVPSGLTVTPVTSKQLNLAWTASTDDTGVQGYRVYRDGTLVATVGTPAFSDTGLTGGVSHTYTVAAIDGAGNASAVSSSAGGTTSAPVRADTYAYDLADRLVGITPATGVGLVVHLRRPGSPSTKTESGITDTYTYAGESSVVVRDAPSSGTRTNAAVDATGSRLAISTSAGGFGWALADLHGDPAGYVAAAGGVVTDATRYDPYGEVSASVSSGLPSPWGYQGRLQLADATDTSLLDFGFRAYAPDLGLFTSPDDQAGSALNPVTFARYLYAGADPETLVDPDGHVALCRYGGEDCGQLSAATRTASTWHGPTAKQTRVQDAAHKAKAEAAARSMESTYGKHARARGSGWTPISLSALDAMSSEDVQTYARINGGREEAWLKANAFTDAIFANPGAFYAADLYELLKSRTDYASGKTRLSMASYVTGDQALNYASTPGADLGVVFLTGSVAAAGIGMLSDSTGPSEVKLGGEGDSHGGLVATPSGTTVAVPSGWTGRVADNGKGIVYQEAGAAGNANSMRIMDPGADPRYPAGYIRFYGPNGQPLDRYGHPGSDAYTHFPLDYNGPIPPGPWSPNG